MKRRRKKMTISCGSYSRFTLWRDAHILPNYIFASNEATAFYLVGFFPRLIHPKLRVDSAFSKAPIKSTNLFSSCVRAGVRPHANMWRHIISCFLNYFEINRTWKWKWKWKRTKHINCFDKRRMCNLSCFGVAELHTMWHMLLASGRRNGMEKVYSVCRNLLKTRTYAHTHNTHTPFTQFIHSFILKISAELTNENKTWDSRYVIKTFP